MKSLLLIFGLVISGLGLNAQSSGAITVTESSLATDWNSVSIVDGIEVFAKEIECPYSDGNNQKMISWKLVNTNSYKVLFRFNKEIYFDDKCLNCAAGSTEELSTFVIESGSSVVTDCANHPEANVFTKFTGWENKTTFTKVDLTELQISKL